MITVRHLREHKKDTYYRVYNLDKFEQLYSISSNNPLGPLADSHNLRIFNLTVYCPVKLRLFNDTPRGIFISFWPVNENLDLGFEYGFKSDFQRMADIYTNEQQAIDYCNEHNSYSVMSEQLTQIKNFCDTQLRLLHNFV